MTHTTKEFELQLLQMNVEIESIHKRGQFVHYAIGFIDGVRYKWDAFGSCFFGLKRKPEYDVKFIVIANDQSHIMYGNEKHIFKKSTFFTRILVCSKCSLKDICGKEPYVHILFPCMPDSRFDKKNGYYKLKKR